MNKIEKVFEVPRIHFVYRSQCFQTNVVLHLNSILCSKSTFVLIIVFKEMVESGGSGDRGEGI